MSNRSKTLYIGVTNDLERRVQEHRSEGSSFTAKYNMGKLVYYESTGDVGAAIRREKHIKGWLRSKKVALIESFNSEWDDLSEAWHTGRRDPSSAEADSG